VDTSSDPNNCGGCGATSSPIIAGPGRCVVQLASPKNKPEGFAFDASSIYWTEMTGSGYVVLKVDKAGGPVATVLSSNSPPLAIGGAHVFLGSGTGLMPVAAPFDASTPYQAFGTSTVATASNIYEFGEMGSLSILPVGGGAAQTVFAGYSPLSLSLGSTAVYWGTPPSTNGTDTFFAQHSIVRLAFGGSSPEVILGGGGSYVGYVTGAGAGGAPGNSDASVAEAGAADTPLLILGPTAVAVDDAYVYWTDGGSGLGFVGKLRLPTSPQGPPPVIPSSAPIALVSGVDRPGNLVRAGTSLYWTTGDGNGAIMTASTDGGAVTTLVSGQTSVSDLFADGVSLYWLSALSSGTNYEIMKLTPR
jgi:hypothetical protein